MGLTATIQSNISTSITSARSVSNAQGSYTSQASLAHDSANNIFTDLSAVASVSTSYDLFGALSSAGPLVNSIGDNFRIGEIYNLQLINQSTTSAITAFGGAADIPILSSAGSVVNIGAGGRFNYDDPRGLAVTPTTADIITIRGTGARFEIMVIGSNA